MSRLQKFESPSVTFTPYQLIRILGWTVSTYNYKRIREAIDRWLGVTLYDENAWRDKKTGQWVDASFHFIEFAEFYKPGKEGVMAQEGSSVIKWNDLIFRNFKEGNLKTLDFHFYRSLESGIAKRMFRFLDKRFHFRSRLSFVLEAFACEKIGLTRPDQSQLHRQSLGGRGADKATIDARNQGAGIPEVHHSDAGEEPLYQGLCRSLAGSL